MGYLDDNMPENAFAIVCSDLYKFRMIVNPGFASDLDLQQLVKEVLPDVQEWQFSGRRFCPRSDRRIPQTIRPRIYAQNSRKMRQFEERVFFAFGTALQRSEVGALFDTKRIKYTIEDEPTPLTQDVIIVVP